MQSFAVDLIPTKSMPTAYLLACYRIPQFCVILACMLNEIAPERLESLRNWLYHHADRLNDLGIAGLLDGLIGSPLGLIASNLLLFSQPVVSLFAPNADLGLLAELMNDPEGAAWLQQQIRGDSDTIER